LFFAPTGEFFIKDLRDELRAMVYNFASRINNFDFVPVPCAMGIYYLMSLLALTSYDDRLKSCMKATTYMPSPFVEFTRRLRWVDSDAAGRLPSHGFLKSLKKPKPN